MRQSVNTLTPFAQGWENEESPDRRSANTRVAVENIHRLQTDKETTRLVHGILAPPDSGSPPHQVVFCGVNHTAATSRICANVARALEAMNASSVCMVEGNIKERPLARLFSVEDEPLAQPGIRSLKERCTDLRGNLWLAGPELFASPAGSILLLEPLQTLFAELSRTFEYVLVDAPALDQSSSAVLFGKATDATIVVMEACMKKYMARRATEMLQGSGIRLLGSVLTNRSLPIPEALYRLL